MSHKSRDARGRRRRRGAVARDDPNRYTSRGKLRTTVYEQEMARLQEQLVLLQYWVQSQGLRVLVIFEGRGSAGKGGVIKTDHRAHQPPHRPGRRAAEADRAASAPSGTSSGTSSTCRPPARWCCSTAAGTTARTSSG